jgi:hypothetical protein
MPRKKVHNILFTWTLVSALFAILIVTFFISPVASQADVTTAISSAKNTFLNCYEAAKAAETAGANITVLTSNLNEAGMLLSQAELAYSSNDLNSARNLAVQSEAKLSNFISDADHLREIATQQRNQDFLITVVGPLLGALAIIGIGVGTWIFLKKKYEHQEQM